MIQYLAVNILISFGYIKRLIYLWKNRNLEKVQMKLLKGIILDNSYTEWGKDHDFIKIKDYDSFSKLHPITEYGDYIKYIDKISITKQNILSRKNVIYFAKTSGTTGKPKIIPVTNDMKIYGRSNIGPITTYNVFKSTHGKIKVLHRVLGLYYGLNNLGSINDINSGEAIFDIIITLLYSHFFLFYRSSCVPLETR